MPVYTVSDALEFKDSILESDPTTLNFILFYNKHTKRILHDITQISEDPSCTSCKFHANDVDESDELADEYHVKHLPTCVLVKGGEIVGRVQTPRDIGVVREIVEKNL